MIKICCAAPKYLPALRSLWMEAFPSEAGFDLFIKYLYQPENTLIATEDEVPVSVIYLYENEALILSDSDSYSCPCFYAFSTAFAFRGRHIGLDLLETALDSCDRSGLPFTMIAPADEGIRRLYCEQFGYRPFFDVRILIFCKASLQTNPLLSVSGSASIRQILPDEYSRLREPLLSGHPHLKLSSAQIEYQQSLSLLCSSGLYRIDGHGETAVIAMERLSDQNLYCLELLCTDSLLPDAIKIIFESFPCDQITVRMPVEAGEAFGGTVHSLALLRPNPLMELPNDFPEHTYGGLIFD